MRFLKVNDQRAINIDEIAMVAVEGRETDCKVVITTKSGAIFTYRWFKDFKPAEQALDELVRYLEGTGQRPPYGRE